MKLIKKAETNHLLPALSKVSGYTEHELTTKRTRLIVPWVKLGMYLARKEGRTFQESADLFGRHFSSSFNSIKEIEQELDEYQLSIDEVLAVKEDLKMEAILQKQKETKNDK